MMTKFRGAPVVMLTTVGRKTGKERTWPLLGIPVGDGYAIAASNSGHDQNPAWYLNLQANPDAKLAVGRETLELRARDATPRSGRRCTRSSSTCTPVPRLRGRHRPGDPGRAARAAEMRPRA